MIYPFAALSRIPWFFFPSCRLRLRLAPTLAVVFCGTVTLATCITGAFVMRSSLLEANLKTAQRLEDAANLLAGRLQPDELETFVQASQVKTPAFQRAHLILNQALKQINGARYIYTLRKNPARTKNPYSRYVFAVDGTPYSSKDFTPPGEVMLTTDSTDALHRVWQTGRFAADHEFVSDRWGTWMSGYIPLKQSDGKFSIVLGIDVSAGEVAAERNRMLRRLLQAYLLSLVIVLPLAAFLGNRLSTPLRVLNHRLQSMARLSFSKQVESIPSGRYITEIQQISHSLETMQAALSDFSRYVPTSLVRQLVLNRDALHLEGEARRLAILFTDIRGFTTLTENMDPSFTLHLLNQYFGVINRVATETKGVLDKYMGDSALVFWGAPDPLDEPARMAVEATLLCQQQLKELNQEWDRQGLDLVFDTCFGIDYGSVVVGNMGPHERVNYTIVGDHVNQAQRLERVNRRFGTQILISAELLTALGDAAEDYLIIDIGEATMRGFTSTITLYELVCRRSEATAEQLRFADQFALALLAYRRGFSVAALEHLCQISEPLQQRPYVLNLVKACEEMIS